MKKITLALLGAAALVMLVSCGSKPEPEPETVPTAPETVVEENEPAADSSAEDAATADKNARESAKTLYESILASKEKIDEWELAEYDQAHYDEGCKLLSELESMMDDDSVSGIDLEAKAKAAKSQFNSVLTIGFKSLAKEWREEAYESKKNADSVKAGVAEKDRYKKAVSDFKEGDSLYAMQAAEKAVDRYISADDEFTALFEELTEKRADAQRAIDAAKALVAEAEKMAIEADITDPVSDDTEGIESQDTVLLEETTYANPDEAVEEIPETISEDAE